MPATSPAPSLRGVPVHSSPSLVIRPPAPPADAVIIGLVAGVAGVAGLAALYGGMSIGKMGIVTSLAGCGSLALPLIAGAFLGHQVGPIQLAGVAPC